MSYILLVEDEPPKREHVMRFLAERHSARRIETAAGVRTGIALIERELPELILLDMSLPTFDVGGGEGGGRPQGTGGIEILRHLDIIDVSVPVIVVTAYPIVTLSGKQVTLDELSTYLAEEHPSNYRTLIYFNSAYGSWQSDLEAALNQEGFNEDLDRR